MCGIAGFYNRDGIKHDTDTACTMLSAIHHRGPDAAGVYMDDCVALGHARLSIIDLSGGNQPIANEDGTVWITYNGEIYNYPELRKDLEMRGHRFSTTCDTEVLVHLYEEKGTSFLNDLNGQWAFALWDSGKRRLMLSRDRVGIRPLFYTVNNGTFFFASEIKSLFTVSQIQKETDPTALNQVFTFWTTLPGKTAFKDINEVKAGTFIQFDDTGMTEQAYWHLPFYGKDEWYTDGPDQLSEQLRDLLVDAVKIRLRADVPVGTYLSGGLDSSGVTAIVARECNPDVKTFGIRFSEKHFDEGLHQRKMVSFLGVKHEELETTNETVGDHFLKTVYHCEKPLLRTAPVPLYLLAEKVRLSDIVVVLTGEGADEFGGGYDIFKEALVRRFWARNPTSQWRGRLIERLYPDIFRNERTRKITGAFFKKGITEYNDPFYSHTIRWNNTSRIKTFFSTEMQAALVSDNPLAECHACLPDTFSNYHTLQKAQYLESAIFLSTYLLSSQGDRMGMAHSIEVRMPYLDYRIMEFMGRVPPLWKICGLHEKHLLKKALQPFLPKSITDRVKHPYRAPVGNSLLSLLKSEKGASLVSANALRETGLFNPEKTGLLFNKARNATMISETDAMALAGIISAQYLEKEFIPKYSIGVIRPDTLNVYVNRQNR